MTAFYFVEPIDSLFVRGNQGFGNSGEHCSGVMPPPPSLFAGAFRSALLGADSAALARFGQRGATEDAELDAVLGSLNPETGELTGAGSFRVAWASLAGRREGKGIAAVERVFAVPADLVKLETVFVRLTPNAASFLAVDLRT